MPYVSDAQRKYFNANKNKLEKQGVDVNEWNEASKGMKLPKHSRKSKKTGMSKGIGASSKM